MTIDPVSSGGWPAVRYVISTTPVLVVLPPALILPLGIWLGHMDAGAEIGFSASTIIPLAAEYLRRGSLTLAKVVARRRCIAMMTALFVATPVLSLLAFVVGFYGVADCFGLPCGMIDQPITVVGLVLAVLALLGSLALISFLRSPVWAQHRLASAERTSPKLFP